VGTGLQQARMPWASLGMVSAIWNIMWFGRTKLEEQ